MIPSVPSDPRNSRSGDGPAPDPGSRRDSANAGGRDHAHRLDEVVDVRVERRVVAAGAGGEPAAERRELERLREVPQRQPVRAQLVLEGGPSTPAWMRARAAHGVHFGHRVEPAQIDGHARVRRTAARSRRPRNCRHHKGSPRCRRAAHQSSRSITSCSRPRARHDVGHGVEPPCRLRTTSRNALPWVCAARSAGSAEQRRASADGGATRARAGRARPDRAVRARSGPRPAAAPRPARSARHAPRRAPRSRQCPSPTTTVSSASSEHGSERVAPTTTSPVQTSHAPHAQRW